MKAAIVTAPRKNPVYGDFEAPVAKEGQEIITVRASALSNLSRSRASGEHYSSSGTFPLIPGVDGVGLTHDGRRVYFALPDAPFGALAELCPVDSRRIIELPDTLDDITAAAIANPGMSAWGSLVARAHLAAGETVLINGATGTAGRIAVQLAKYLGAAKVIATGRNPEELAELKQLGADVVLPFSLGLQHPSGARDYEDALSRIFATGIDVVIDYLWGESAKTIIVALAKSLDDGVPVRFVHVGAASEPNMELPGAALRAAAITLMGSGVGSVSRPDLLRSIKSIFEAAQPAGLKIATRAIPLSEIEDNWSNAATKPRLVFTIG